MSRKKEILEMDVLAVETTSDGDAFMGDAAQQGGLDAMEEKLDSEMESGGEGSEGMADDADNPEGDTLADFMEEENALLESAEDAGEEMQPEEGAEGQE